MPTEDTLDSTLSCLVLLNPQSASLAVPEAVSRMLGLLTAGGQGVVGACRAQGAGAGEDSTGARTACKQQHWWAWKATKAGRRAGYVFLRAPQEQQQRRTHCPCAPHCFGGGSSRPAEHESKGAQGWM